MQDQFLLSALRAELNYQAKSLPKTLKTCEQITKRITSVEKMSIATQKSLDLAFCLGRAGTIQMSHFLWNKAETPDPKYNLLNFGELEKIPINELTEEQFIMLHSIFSGRDFLNVIAWKKRVLTDSLQIRNLKLTGAVKQDYEALLEENIRLESAEFFFNKINKTSHEDNLILLKWRDDLLIQVSELREENKELKKENEELKKEKEEQKMLILKAAAEPKKDDKPDDTEPSAKVHAFFTNITNQLETLESRFNDELSQVVEFAENLASNFEKRKQEEQVIVNKLEDHLTKKLTAILAEAGKDVISQLNIQYSEESNKRLKEKIEELTNLTTLRRIQDNEGVEYCQKALRLAVKRYDETEKVNTETVHKITEVKQLLGKNKNLLADIRELEEKAKTKETEIDFQHYILNTEKHLNNLTLRMAVLEEEKEGRKMKEKRQLGIQIQADQRARERERKTESLKKKEREFFNKKEKESITAGINEVVKKLSYSGTQFGEYKTGDVFIWNEKRMTVRDDFNPTRRFKHNLTGDENECQKLFSSFWFNQGYTFNN